MAIMGLTIFSLLLTIAIIVTLISYIVIVNLNKKLTRGNNDVENINELIILSKQKDNNLNGILEVNDLSTGEINYYMKLSSDTQYMASFANNITIEKEIENESINECEVIKKTSTKSVKETKSETESYFSNSRTIIDPEFLHRITSLVYREIANTDNIIEVISSELCLSSSQLNRRIKILTGMTISHFIHELRLKRAQKLLASTQKPIGEIAAECGFNDFAYFSRSFKNKFEMTPTTYQRMPH